MRLKTKQTGHVIGSGNVHLACIKHTAHIVIHMGHIERIQKHIHIQLSVKYENRYHDIFND